MSARWLRTEAVEQSRLWCLFVGFVTPQFPLTVPGQYFPLYSADPPLPMQYAPVAWARHAVLEFKRRQEALDDPFDGKTTRNAMAACYGPVTFLDEQIGIVLLALTEAGLADTTRATYTSDYGEMLGEHGLWVERRHVRRDLAGDLRWSNGLVGCEQELRTICDPRAIDARQGGSAATPGGCGGRRRGARRGRKDSVHAGPREFGSPLGENPERASSSAR